jgi:hypothetical protein
VRGQGMDAQTLCNAWRAGMLSPWGCDHMEMRRTHAPLLHPCAHAPCHCAHAPCSMQCPRRAPAARQLLLGGGGHRRSTTALQHRGRSRQHRAGAWVVLRRAPTATPWGSPRTAQVGRGGVGAGLPSRVQLTAGGRARATHRMSQRARAPPIAPCSLAVQAAANTSAAQAHSLAVQMPMGAGLPSRAQLTAGGRPRVAHRMSQRVRAVRAVANSAARARSLAVRAPTTVAALRARSVQPFLPRESRAAPVGTG